MARPIDAAKVIEIMETELTETQIQPYISSAYTYINSILLGKGLSDSLLEQIECWLTAHMIALTRERIAKSEEAGGAKITYAGEFGKSFDATPYGQMAVSLDSSGTLAALIGGKRASISAIKS